MKGRPFPQRLGFATAGIRTVWRRERSFRVQSIFAGLAGAAMLVAQPGFVWCAILVLAVGLVLALEAVNSALEYLVDHLHPSFAVEIGHAKDAAAGAVLIASVVALAVGAAMLTDVWNRPGRPRTAQCVGGMVAAASESTAFARRIAIESSMMALQHPWHMAAARATAIVSALPPATMKISRFR